MAASISAGSETRYLKKCADRSARRGRNRGPRGEIYFEHTVIGRAVKVSAIHADSGTEVSITGPIHTTQQELERVALQKLLRALERNR